MTTWELPPINDPKSHKAIMSVRPYIRALIEDKIAIARRSEPHRQFLQEYSDTVTAAKVAVRREKAAEIRREVQQQLEASQPDVRLAKLRKAREEHEASIEAVRAKRDALELDFFHHTRDALAEQAERHEEAVRQAHQRHWLSAIYVSLYAVRLCNAVVGRQVIPHTAADVLPPAHVLRRRMVEARSTLDHYVAAFATRRHKVRVRLRLVRAVARFFVAMRRAKVAVAIRQIRYTFTTIAGVGKTLVAVKRFHQLVRRAQRIARDFLACAAARRVALKRQVERCNASIWNAAAKAAAAAATTPKKKRAVVVVRSLDQHDVAELVHLHTDALRRSNQIALKTYLGQLEELHARRRAVQRAFIAAREEQPGGGRPSWPEIDANVRHEFTSRGWAVPRLPTLRVTAPADVLTAQVRGLIAALRPLEGAPNPTDVMMTVTPKEQIALAAFARQQAAHTEQLTKKVSKLKEVRAKRDDAPVPLLDYPPPPGGWRV